MDMEEHERIRRSMMGWYAMFGSKPITYDEKEQKDCSSVSTEDRKDEAKALGREDWASSDVRHLLVHHQHNALPLHDGSDGQGYSKASSQ